MPGRKDREQILPPFIFFVMGVIMELEEIVMQIKQGNNKAYTDLWLAVRKLVEWYARRYYTGITAGGKALGGVEVEDLIQCGFIALYEAVQGYDPKAGSFAGYFRYHIKNQFRQAIGRTDTQLRDPLNHSSSLDVPIREDSEETKLYIVPDTRDYISEADDRIFQKELHRALEAALFKLPKQEAKAIRSVYYDGKTQQIIAQEMNCSFQRVSQLCKDGLRHIRKSSSKNSLEAFLDSQTSFYSGVSLRAFQNKGSQVERLTISRDIARREYKGVIKLKYVTEKPIPKLIIGRRETNAVTVKFIYKSWVEEFGFGTIQLWFRSPADMVAHQVNLTLPDSDYVAIWNVSMEDTAVSGTGAAQLVYNANSGAIKKSNIFTVQILEDIFG